MVDIKKGQAASSDVNHQLSLLQSDIRTIHPSRTVETESALGVWGTVPYLFLQLVPVLLFLAFVFGRRYYNTHFLGSSSQRLSAAAKEAIHKLEATHAQAATLNSSAYCGALSQTLTHFVATVFRIDRAQLSKETICDELRKHHMDETKVSAISQLINECQYAQYAPVETGQQEALYQQSLEAIRQIAALNALNV